MNKNKQIIFKNKLKLYSFQKFKISKIIKNKTYVYYKYKHTIEIAYMSHFFEFFSFDSS